MAMRVFPAMRLMVIMTPRPPSRPAAMRPPVPVAVSARMGIPAPWKWSR
jgi:hypothetical protein